MPRRRHVMAISSSGLDPNHPTDLLVLNNGCQAGFGHRRADGVFVVPVGALEPWSTEGRGGSSGCDRPADRAAGWGTIARNNARAIAWPAPSCRAGPALPPAQSRRAPALPCCGGYGGPGNGARGSRSPNPRRLPSLATSWLAAPVVIAARTSGVSINNITVPARPVCGGCLEAAAGAADRWVSARTPE